MGNKKNQYHILGLDVGANSVGWAILKIEKAEDSSGLVAVGIENMGVRVFEAGVEGDIESGKDQSRGVDRRDARSARKRLDRRARRLNLLFALLQGNGLLPGAENEHKNLSRLQKATSRHEILTKLHKTKVDAFKKSGANEEQMRLFAKKLPYLIRARALDDKLDRDEIGFAIYSLAQRRGYLSNRKAPPKKDEKPGEVLKGIGELEQKIKDTGSRTLGEYFSRLDPEQERIRKKWTARAMYLDEFDKVWLAQQTHYPEILTDDFKRKIHRAIFFQRKLKVQKQLIGKCELEKDCPRAPMALIDAQRFRMLQQVNNTQVKQYGELPRDLTAQERSTLAASLDIDGDLTFTKAKNLLGLSKRDKFNFESGGETKFLGNRTAAKLAEIFGAERWTLFSDEEKNAVVEDWMKFEKAEALARRGMKKWGLDEGAAKKFGELSLESSYCRLSKKALKKLLPLMEQGVSYSTAVLEIYDPPAPEPEESLPPIEKAMPELRNPVVSRALTETRKVVDAIVRQYGKPAMIRVELARDIKKSRKEREEIWKKNRGRERERNDAVEKIKTFAEAGISSPKGMDIEKYLLWIECDGKCPYTGKSISMGDLFGKSPQFDVEHIIPFSRCLDNSFNNKTLCYHEENRHVKKNKTPYEAYGHNESKWNEILQRVKDFKGDAAETKLRRFQLTTLEEISDFTTRQLNDTRYASRVAKRYLGLLYGGEQAKRPVQAARGQTTKFLRDVWDLNKILSDGGEKSRDDHRHHAVDAVAIALTSPAIVKALSDASKNPYSERRRLFAKVQPPWEGFFDDVKKSIDSIIVSHRVSRKINGPLHEETLYSPQKVDENGKPCTHVRKPLDGLSKQDIDKIVDPVVRELVRNKLYELGDGEPKKLFGDKNNHPFMTTKDGRKIPIHKVRIRKPASAFKIGNGVNERHVFTDSNHHMEIIEVKDKKSKTKWEGHIVSRYEAFRRLRAGEPVIKHDHGEGKKFVFSVSGGDVILLEEEKGSPHLFIIRTISGDNLEIVLLNDARLKQDIKSSGDWKKRSVNKLRELNCRKVSIGPLGEVRWAND